MDGSFDSHTLLCHGEGTIVSTLQMRKESQGVEVTRSVTEQLSGGAESKAKFNIKASSSAPTSFMIEQDA